jgi:hypothetical protein
MKAHEIPPRQFKKQSDATHRCRLRYPAPLYGDCHLIGAAAMLITNHHQSDGLKTALSLRKQFGGVFDGRYDIAVVVNFLAAKLTLSSCGDRKCSIRR